MFDPDDRFALKCVSVFIELRKEKAMAHFEQLSLFVLGNYQFKKKKKKTKAQANFNFKQRYTHVWIDINFIKEI